MLLTFSPDGRVDFTRNPDILSIVPAGHLAVERMTEIEFCEDSQAFYMSFNIGYFANCELSWAETDRKNYELSVHWNLFITEHSPSLVDIVLPYETDKAEQIYDEWIGYRVMFRTYEDAVKVEVAFVDYLREQGIAMR